MKVAVASENGAVVQEHFGRATQFLIYEIEEEGCRLVEIRKNHPACGSAPEGDGEGHSEDRMQDSIELVSDCRAVVVAQIGRAAVERLANRGVHAFVIPDFIDSALQRLKASGRLAELVTPGEGQFKWLRS
jgi:predicted Fe-Mo cluster-binding NifX family protein